MDDPKGLILSEHFLRLRRIVPLRLNKKVSPKYDKSIDIYSAKGACMSLKGRFKRNRS